MSISQASNRQPIKITTTVSERVQKLKDATQQKEILKDVTASEFALRLEVSNRTNSKIDYDMLISNLNHDIDLLKSQRERGQSLLLRVEETKNALLYRKSVQNERSEDDNYDDDMTEITTATADSILKSETSEQPLSDIKDLRARVVNELRLIVREDGTVDWLGEYSEHVIYIRHIILPSILISIHYYIEAKKSSREVAKFGVELWERINGKEEGFPSLPELFGQMQSKVIETDEIKRLNEIVVIARNELADITAARNDLKGKLRASRRTNTTIESSDIQKLQLLELNLKEMEKRVKVFTLNYDMERVCVYLYQEIESSGISAANYDQRALIAQASLVDKQLSAIMAGLRLSIGSSSDEIAASRYSLSTGIKEELISLIDDDELTLICSEAGLTNCHHNLPSLL